MRVNVYAQELTERMEVVETVAANTGARFVGLRFYLKTHDDLIPPNHPDDDSSAVTFWVPSKKEGYKPGDEKPLVNILANAIDELQRKAWLNKEDTSYYLCARCRLIAVSFYGDLCESCYNRTVKENT